MPNNKWEKISDMSEDEFTSAFNTINVNRDALHSALRVMGRNFLKTKRMKDMWSLDCPTTNYCYTVSEFIYWYKAKEYRLRFNHKGQSRVSVCFTNIPSIPGIKHCFLTYQHYYGFVYIWDLTADQFEDYNELIEAYKNARRGFFVQSGCKGPSSRARHLARLMGYDEDEWET